ncbi:MAG: M23 family metallopeptidase [Proteobacteria bacterium]|nr:M23 family metallopeptidase [Pseudomonadota bacterium]
MDDPSGIKPIFPKKISCVQISSPYGSRTRYDGSLRPENRFNGRHGGIDLSLNPGTPLLAVASGKLVHKAMGNQMEGIYLWLLHSPDDTGLDYWVFSKYQHLQNLPTIDMGDNVIKGQVIAYSGKTGTSGGHYGSKGYPHLHLSTIRSFSGKYLIENNELLQKSALLFDPLLIFKQPHQEIKKKGAYTL